MGSLIEYCEVRGVGSQEMCSLLYQMTVEGPKLSLCCEAIRGTSERSIRFSEFARPSISRSLALGKNGSITGPVGQTHQAKRECHVLTQHLDQLSLFGR